ncbi:uncharacterized protein LOC134821156 [Bolinopsis microptera]|uniref:uncharacterized protein LOC134821156 n=1 Tax=Bolinopsis microptera TaxID=2820187 RepID=UPI003079322B
MKWIHDGHPEQQHDMYFYTSKKSTLLFKTWEIDTNTEFWLAIFGIIALGVVYEMLQSFRSCLILEARTNEHLEENKPILQRGEDRSCFEKLCVHSVLTVIYTLEMFIMFILMVIFMSYNVYFCIATLLGVALGYFFFGSSRVYAGQH